MSVPSPAAGEAPAPIPGYAFHESFEVADDVGEAYGIDIERNSRYSHGHGIVSDGLYEILLSGNRHRLATPRLADFRLDMEWSIQTPGNLENTVLGGIGRGLLILFRYDPDTERSHRLELFHGRGHSSLSLLADGKVVACREKDETDLTLDQHLTLEVHGNEACVSTCGIETRFPLEEGPARGYVALDAAPHTNQLLLVRSVDLTSPEHPVKEEFARYRISLGRSQGFSAPVEYEVALSRYESGETLLEAELSGTIRSRPMEGRVVTGGHEWESIIERLDTPYIRIAGPDGSTFAKCNFWNGDRWLRDAEVNRWRIETNRPAIELEPWPKHFTKTFRTFPPAYTVAAGYRRAIADPLRFTAERERERMVAQDGALLYDGAPLEGGGVFVRATSPADKRLVSRIPADIPHRDEALAHARNQHYFYESETVRFRVEAFFRDADWTPSEISVEPTVTDVFGDAVATRLVAEEAVVTQASGGIRSVVRETRLEKPLPCGVYKLRWTLRAGAGPEERGQAIFEVLPDDPDGPCPPLASGLPLLLAMPNEFRYYEQNAFDPWAEFGGAGHYYALDTRYPKVGNELEIWRLLPTYRRSWWCWNWARNSDQLDMSSDFNLDLVRHARYFGGVDQKLAWLGRYELGCLYFYKGHQLDLLREFLREKGLEEEIPVAQSLPYDSLKKLFNTCWEEWVEWARPRIDAATQEFADFLLSVNPRVGQACYGPYGFYASCYKTAYALRYDGYPIIRDPRLRENGSFWLLEEYHHSCDYPLCRAALFVATYDLHYGGSGRRIYPEIYYAGWERCFDGAVFRAHPMSLTYLPPSHQRRVAYQYAFGTPQFRDGKYRFWSDDGFHARDPESEEIEEFIYAWGKVVHNRPVKAVKSPILVHDLDALKRNGEYLDEDCNGLGRWNRDKYVPFADVCNTAEEDLAYVYEQSLSNGYSAPVATTFAEIGCFDASNAEFVLLPPIVEGTPQAVIDAIRALHGRGVPLVAFEQVVGLEDIFGVRRASERHIGRVGDETFSNKMAMARYVAEGAETLLYASESAGATADIPLVLAYADASGRAVLVNAPPASIRRSSFREGGHAGQESLCVALKAAMGKAFAFAAPEPAVKAERGLVFATVAANGDLSVILSDEPPFYKDRTRYPMPLRLTLRLPGIELAEIEADAPFTVVSRDPGQLILRTSLERDTASFFAFRRKA